MSLLLLLLLLEKFPQEGGKAETCYTWKTMVVDVFGEDESVYVGR